MSTDKKFENFPAIEKESEFQTGLTFSCDYFYFNDTIDIYCSSIMLEKFKSYMSITLVSELYWSV